MLMVLTGIDIVLFSFLSHYLIEVMLIHPYLKVFKQIFRLQIKIILFNVIFIYCFIAD